MHPHDELTSRIPSLTDTIVEGWGVYGIDRTPRDTPRYDSGTLTLPPGCPLFVVQPPPVRAKLRWESVRQRPLPPQPEDIEVPVGYDPMYQRGVDPSRLSEPQMRALMQARDRARDGYRACLHRREMHPRTYKALVRDGYLDADPWGWCWLTRLGWLAVPVKGED